MESMTFDKLAALYYKAYCANSGNKNFRGDPCPGWDVLPAAIREHWRVVAVESVRLSEGGYFRDIE